MNVNINGVEVAYVDKEGNLAAYDPEQHMGKIFKFLFWLRPGMTPLIVVGHALFVEAGTHEGLLNFYAGIVEPADVPSETPDGAGNFCHGKPALWSSRKFGITTKEEHRPVILEVLGFPMGCAQPIS